MRALEVRYPLPVSGLFDTPNLQIATYLLVIYRENGQPMILIPIQDYWAMQESFPYSWDYRFRTLYSEVKRKLRSNRIF